MPARPSPWPIVVWAALVAGCAAPVMPSPDAGGTPDAGPSDLTAPTIRDTTPAEGVFDVARDAELVVRFSEPMAPAVGTITVAPGGSVRRPTDGEWDAAGSTLRIPGTFPWPSGEVTLSFGADFADRAGNALAPDVVTFTTVDDVAPTVTATVPTEGAVGLSARLGRVELAFDEPMRAEVGTIDVLGGAATVGAAEWSADTRAVAFPVADLEYLRDYQVVLRGFRDGAGNLLDGTPVLGDGVIDFSTGPDLEGPRVVRGEPAEGQLDVNPADTLSILVTFDEAMDAGTSEVTLSGGGLDVPLVGTWTGSARVLRVSVAGRLDFGVPYALDLTALRDRAGNAIDEVAYLGDGALDFTVGLDAFLPFVQASTPAEGETDVSYADISDVSLTFSEAMDTTVTRVPLESGGAPVDLTGVWASPTELVVDVLGRLGAGRAVSLDLRGMRDQRGNLLDASHRILMDGRLDFTTSAPAGDGCRDPLTVAEATATGDEHVWTIGSLDGATRDGGTASCDANGTAANGTDVLVRYDKVSGTTGSGGRYLRIVLDGGSGTATTVPYDVAVMTGAACDPLAAPVSCQSNAAFQETFLDLPAGPVWIWLARTALSTSAATVTLTVSEVSPPRLEGDSCDAPYTSASAIYTAPTATDPVHHFAIPQNVLRSVDVTSTTNVAPNTFACDPLVGHGIDGVVRFDKPDDASVLSVSAHRTAGTDTLDFGVFSACDPAAPGARALGCETNVGSTGTPFLLDVPAGPVWLWVADTATTVSRSSSTWLTNAGVTIDVEVIPDVATGEMCSRAFAASVGANAVAGTSDARLEAPPCIGSVWAVEWYLVRTTDDVLVVSSDVPGAIAAVDPVTHVELACAPDAQAAPLSRVLPVGTDVCIAVQMDSGIGSFTVAMASYDGLGSRPPVDLGILPPLTATGTSEESVAGDFWMAVAPDVLLMRHISSAVMDVGRAGGERAVRRGVSDGVSSANLGRVGVVSGGALFSFTTSGASSTSRVHRLWDGRSAFWTPTVWDLAPSYVTSPVQAAATDGSSGIVYVTDGATPSFYRISTLAPSTPVLLGSNTSISGVRGLALDDQYLYVTASALGSAGVFRLSRADVSATPELLAFSTTFSTSTSQATPMAVDAATAPRYLYVRNQYGEVEAFAEPAGPLPRYLGPVIDRGRAGDWAMTLDPATGQLYLFETESDADGVWLRYDP